MKEEQFIKNLKLLSRVKTAATQRSMNDRLIISTTNAQKIINIKDSYPFKIRHKNSKYEMQELYNLHPHAKGETSVLFKSNKTKIGNIGELMLRYHYQESNMPHHH